MGDRQTFERAEDRLRLTPAAHRAYGKMAERWKLTAPAATALLGLRGGAFDPLAPLPAGMAWERDVLLRISALLGVFKALHSIFADQMADQWVNLPNTGPIFAGKTPVEAMTQGGLAAMLEVRQHLLALFGGPDPSILDLLAQPGGDEIAFDPPRMGERNLGNS